jgi:hypothetical protein
VDAVEVDAVGTDDVGSGNRTGTTAARTGFENVRQRGQVYTLEGIFAGIVVLLGLLFAMQATTTAPGAGAGAGGSDAAGDRALARDALSAADGRELREAVLYWGSEGFHCSPDGIDYYPGRVVTSGCSPPVPDALPPTELGAALSDRLGPAYSYNVAVLYEDGGSVERARMVYQGEPGADAVRARTSVAIADGDRLVAADGSDGPAVGSGGFYAPAADGDTDGAYAVVAVEVIVWRG